MQRSKLFTQMFLARSGLVMGAILPEIAKLDDVPEFQRPWYAADASGKFKLDFSKVDVEDVTGLRNSVGATREEARKAKMLADQKFADLQKQYEGIDPVKVRDLLGKFNNEEEAALIAAGKLDQVIEKRMEKQRTELMRQVEEEKTKANGALEVASTFMTRVLDNEIRSAVTGKVHASALKNGDILRAAREIFSLDDDGKAVQYDDDDVVVVGKDGKTPFSPDEWIESMRAIAPHWFPAAASGGGAPGSKNTTGARPDWSGLSPAERITQARAAQGKKA